MKTIILSTQHKWVEKIHLKIKTDEVRKTAPGTPFKALIYDTKSSGGCGKVVSEFICDDCITVFPTMDILKIWYTYGDVYDFTNACLTEMDLHIYGRGKPLRVLHISDLKIYDKPKELSEFKHRKKYDWWDYGHHENKPQWEIESLDRAPQSWCYVEEDK